MNKIRIKKSLNLLIETNLDLLICNNNWSNSILF